MQQKNEAEEPRDNKRLMRLNLSPRAAKTVVAAVVLLIAVTATAPFYFSRYEQASGGASVRRLITTHDLWMHLHTMEQFDKDLRSGVIYPRWIADINHGYGILTLIYYPPGFFYLASAIHVVFPDWLNTLFVLTALSLAASGLALYFLARLFYSVLASAVAAALYMMAPIHMLDLYWRGGLPQVVGYIFPPLAIYFAYKLGRAGKPRYYAGLGLIYGLHLLTHLPVALMFSYGLGFFAVVWAVKERDWRIGARFAGAMAIGLLLSAIYWLPAALETKYAYEFATDLFPYHRSYITLLEVSNMSLFPEFYRVLNIVFFMFALALIVILVVLKVVLRSDLNEAGPKRQWTPLSMWIVMAIATTFMCTSFSIYISKLLPKIQVAVPAWRWLALAVMFLSLLAAATVDLLRRRTALAPRIMWACRAGFALVIVLNIVLSIRSTIIKPLSNPTYHPVSTSDVVESSWTPKDATHPEELADTPLVVTEPEAIAVEVTRWDPQHRDIHVRVNQPSTVRLKTYNFPGWTARVDGNVVPMLSDKDGIQQVEVPAGLHVVRATFENTPPRTAGTLLSGVGVLLILGLSLAGRVRQPRPESEEVVEGAAHERQPESVIASTAKGKTAHLKTAGLIAAVVIVVIGAAIVVTTTRRSGPGNTNSTTEKAAVPGSRAPSAETHLYLAGQDSIIVAVDEKALDQLLTALSGRDKPALDALVDSGRALKVPNNTAVRVLEIGTGKARIRIIEGEHMMVDGWVPERWLR